MKGWKDISQELMQAFFANSDEVRMGIDRPAVANVLKELIAQFKEVYEIDVDEDEEDEYYRDDFVIKTRDIMQVIWELEK